MGAAETYGTDHGAQSTPEGLPRELRMTSHSLSDGDLESAVGRRIVDLVRGIVRSELYRHRSASPEDIEDVCSDAIVALLSQAEEVRSDSESEAEIRDFDAYAAVIARRACSAWSRRRYPAFYNLRTRLRYLLKRDSRFALWQDPRGEWLCGLAKGKSATNLMISEWDFEAFESVSRADQPIELLCALFEHTASPMRFNNLVRICAEFWEVIDTPETLEFMEVNASGADSVEISLDRRAWLQRLWNQMQALPVRHCAALLLNLRGLEGDCAASLLVFTGVVTLQDLAAAVGMTPEIFAELWPRMPLSDLEIAERLQITRQQVINLRKSAKERLRKCMDQVNLTFKITDQRNKPGQSMHKG